MLITVTTRRTGPGDPPATDLGFVLHKHPEHVRSVATTGGQATVFWPEASEDRATMALLVDIDPVGLVRRGGGPATGGLRERPALVASSFLAVAVGRLFRTAMNDDCPGRPELVAHRWPVEVRLPAVPIGGDRRIIDQLFEPLGYRSTIVVPPLDHRYPDWGSATVADVTLEGTVTMGELLRHLYVLLPVLDDDKHYWIDDAEVSKLLRQGEGWLTDHPERTLIARRYLGNHRDLAAKALALLGEPGPDAILGENGAAADAAEATIEKPLSLHDQRMAAVVGAVVDANPATVVDLGCGEGNVLARLAELRSIERLVGVDPTLGALRRAERRLQLDRRPARQRPAIELFHSSLAYRDPRLDGFDLALLVEVIEHIDPSRLEAVEPILFRHLRPRTVVVTTPNRDYNPLFGLADGNLRHRDHRFEWSRREFARWCRGIGDRYGYQHRLDTIGPVDPAHGAPTQLAVLTAGPDDGQGDG